MIIAIVYFTKESRIASSSTSARTRSRLCGRPPLLISCRNNITTECEYVYACMQTRDINSGTKTIMHRVLVANGYKD